MIIFFIGFYFLNRKEKKFGEKIEEKFFIEPKNFLEDLKKIEKNFLNSSENIFYGKISLFLKEFLEEKNFQKFEKNIENMTFSEIQKLDFGENSKNIIDLISSVYFKSYEKEKEEFLNENEKRLSLIGEIKKVLI